jgi:hypothetical protein
VKTSNLGRTLAVTSNDTLPSSWYKNKQCEKDIGKGEKREDKVLWERIKKKKRKKFSWM